MTINSIVTPGSVTFNNVGEFDFDFSGTGSIGGLASVVKNGTGTTVFGTNNNYSGTTTINAGVLAIGVGGTTPAPWARAM